MTSPVTRSASRCSSQPTLISTGLQGQIHEVAYDFCAASGEMILQPLPDSLTRRLDRAWQELRSASYPAHAIEGNGSEDLLDVPIGILTPKYIARFRGGEAAWRKLPEQSSA